MNIIPFGPIVPKKPKPKKVQIEVEGDIVFGWIDADSKPIAGVEIFSTDGEQYGVPLDGIYIIPEYSYSIQVVNGIIQ